MGLLLVARAPAGGSPLALYQTAATVIPVLFLAFIYQVKGLEHPLGWVENQFLSTTLFVAVAVVGEVAAFRVLATQHPTSTAKTQVLIALIFIGLDLASEPVTDAAAGLIAAKHIRPLTRGITVVAGFGTLILLIGFGTGLF